LSSLANHESGEPPKRPKGSRLFGFLIVPLFVIGCLVGSIRIMEEILPAATIWEIPWTSPGLPDFDRMPKVIVLGKERQAGWTIKTPTTRGLTPKLEATIFLTRGAYDVTFEGYVVSRHDGSEWSIQPTGGSFFSTKGHLKRMTATAYRVAVFPTETIHGGGGGGTMDPFPWRDVNEPSVP
jgi:hypothetical protein